MLKKVRVDKWLWSVRIFKSRTISSETCKAGKVKIDGKALKPSHLLVRGETLQVRKNGFDMVYKVVDLLDKRVSATLAEPCYENLTPKEELEKYSDWFKGKKGVETRDKGEGRPTKKDRRHLDRYKDDRY